MKKFLLLLTIVGICHISFGQTTIASWSFEGLGFSSTAATTPTLTGTGSFTADAGPQTANSSFTGNHASSSTVYSSPAGNYSVNSFSSNGWAVNDYYQFQVKTSGYSGISISFDATGSGTGPADFKVQYSTDNITYTDVASATYKLTVDSWSAPTSLNSSYKTVSTKTFSLSSITALDNTTTVFIRLVNTTTSPISSGTLTASTGTSRVDNFTFTAAHTLPISLTTFTGKPFDKSVLLNWNTASEENNDFFDVQHSADGKTFSSIGKISGAGTSKVSKDYSFTDDNPFAGTNYYKLVQHDYDGKTSASNTIAVDSKIAASQLSVYAGSSDVKITLSSPNKTKGLLQLFDISGRKLAENSVEVNKGYNNFSLPVSLQAGVHFVRYISESESVNIKFVR